MYNDVDITELQKAAVFMKVKARLTLMGISSIVFGVIAICIGLATDIQAAKFAVMTIGISLMIEGAWLLANPSLVGILAEFFSYLGFLFWIIIMSMEKWSVLDLILYVFLLKNVLAMYHMYKEFRGIAGQKPALKSMAILRSMIKDILARDIFISNDIIEMKTKDIWYGPKITGSGIIASIKARIKNNYESIGTEWRVFLGEHMVVYVSKSGYSAYAQNRDNVTFVVYSNDENENAVTVMSSMPKDMRFRMSKEHYQRYLAWKGVSVV